MTLPLREQSKDFLYQWARTAHGNNRKRHLEAEALRAELNKELEAISARPSIDPALPMILGEMIGSQLGSHLIRCLKEAATIFTYRGDTEEAQCVVKALRLIRERLDRIYD